MNERQIQMAKAFLNVTFQIGSYDKRFCYTMLAIATSNPEFELTEKQANLLEEKYHRYRKQIPHHKALCSVCGKGVR